MFRQLTLCLVLISFSLQAERYLIGIEAINFYPHYDFSPDSEGGFANEVFVLFAEISGLKLEMVPLPPKRLYHELDRRMDFIYPDHPRWVQYQGTAPQRYFSQAVTGNLGTAMIRPQLADARPEDIRSVAIIHGFTPVAWLSRSADRIDLIEVPDAQSAIGLVLKGRVDAADVEYNVGSHILRQSDREGDLLPALNLPYTLGSYHLSSVKHPQIIEQFDKFLLEHQTEIQRLKSKYRIKERLEQLPQGRVSPIENDN
ncbi:substrate-binding periplasmic protein [Lacimicrobium alkaliphilum]|uniref:Solute-binding protein family 3/N-terminal domain-containing protein n=1 Tax=Lacimicrobium alkaliphilum TaxID=1526571 RepID=A0A0U2PK42_9ALTE|nr:transporter substrate-binding domain-containing protein [Lacimicrobium alkaliphilum]ALS99933.1 hypothetical protein AT746_17795 [Lacimicrobium alkaliphilum]